MHARKIIKELLSRSLYGDNVKTLKAAVDHITQIIETSAPMHDGIHIKLAIHKDSQLPGMQELNNIYEAGTSDPMLSKVNPDVEIPALVFWIRLR